jgi:two-component system, NarL family, sensor kinase
VTIHVAVRAIQEPQSLLAAALDAVPAPVAVLDEAGTILVVNESWRQFLRPLRVAIPSDGIGISYLKAGILAAVDPRHVFDLRSALKQLLRGSLDRFQRSVRMRTDDAKRWYQVSAVRAAMDGESRIVVTHTDISAIQNAHATIKDLSRRLLSAQDEERQRIALDLHDSTAQQLVAIGLHMMALRRTLPQDADAQHTLDQMERAIEEAQKEIRAFSYLLNPPCLDEDGLKITLTQFIDGFCRRTGLRATMQIENQVDDFTPEVQRTVLRIVQEALANVHRHACATEVRVIVETTHDTLLLSVVDNGRGLAADGGDASRVHRPGLGLAGMRTRLRQFGGVLKIATGSEGTTVSGAVPLSECREELPLLHPSFRDVRVLPRRFPGNCAVHGGEPVASL